MGHGNRPREGGPYRGPFPDSENMTIFIRFLSWPDVSAEIITGASQKAPRCHPVRLPTQLCRYRYPSGV